MIKLTHDYGGFAEGSVIEEAGDVENTLINLGKAKRTTDAKNEIALKDKRPPEPEQPVEPVKLSTPEALLQLRNETRTVRNQWALGSKTDADAIGTRLDEIDAKIQAILDQDYPDAEKNASQQTASLASSGYETDPAQAYRNPPADQPEDPAQAYRNPKGYQK